MKPWLNSSALQLKLILDGMPINLSHFNLNMYYDDMIFLFNMIKEPRLIEAIKLVDSKDISNVWSLLTILRETNNYYKIPGIKEILDYPEFNDDYSILQRQVSDTGYFYSKKRTVFVDSWRTHFARDTDTRYPDDFLKTKERYA